MLVILDGGDRRTAFSKPQAFISTRTIQEVPGALIAMPAVRAEGQWLAGWLAYELSYRVS